MLVDECDARILNATQKCETDVARFVDCHGAKHKNFKWARQLLLAKLRRLKALKITTHDA